MKATAMWRHVPPLPCRARVLVGTRALAPLRGRVLATNHPPSAGVTAPGGTSFSITDSPSTTTSYWVKVNNCNGGVNVANSNTVTVTVTTGNTCVQPNITANPQGVTIVAGQTATLTVAASGTNLHYAWFQGATAVGSDSPSLTTAPLFSDAQFSVKVTNDCGNATSQTATVTVKPARRRSVHH